MIDIVTGLTRRAQLTGERLVLSIVAYVVVGILLASTYVALMVALGMTLSSHYGPVTAALAIAGATLVTSVIVLLLLRWRDRRLAMRARMMTQRGINASSGAALAAVVPIMMRASPVGTLVAAGALAYIFSRATSRNRREH